MSAYAHLALRLRRSSLFLCKPRLPELRHPFIASVLLSPILCSSDVCLVGLRGLGCGHSGRLMRQRFRFQRSDFDFSTRLRNVISFFLMATTFSLVDGDDLFLFACSAASAAATAASRSNRSARSRAVRTRTASGSARYSSIAFAASAANWALLFCNPVLVSIQCRWVLHALFASLNRRGTVTCELFDRLP